MSLLDHLCRNHWAMEPNLFDQMRAILERHAAGVKLAPAEIKAAIGRAPGAPNPKDRKYEVHQGMALVPIQGVISKHASDVGDISQPQGSSSEDIQQSLATALADREVSRILLCIESPGGSVDGTAAAYDAVRAATALKPVWAFIDGMGCSAAYWIACGASRIIATTSSQVGSIGVLAALRDTSKADEKAGFRTVVVRSGPYKALGQRGEAIGDLAQSATQEIVNGLAAMFFSAVASSRKLSPDALAQVTDGRVFLARTAQSLGLIDGMSSYQDALYTFLSMHSETAKRPAIALAQSSPTAQAQPAMEAWAAIVDHYRLKGDRAPHSTAAAKAPDLRKAMLAEFNTSTARAPSAPAQSKDHTMTVDSKAEIIKTYEARIAELKAKGIKDPYRQIATNEPDLAAAYLDAVNDR